VPGQAPYPRLAAFAEAMHQRFGADAEQIADTLWLACVLPPGTLPYAASDAAGPAGGEEPARPARDRGRLAELSPPGRRGHDGEPRSALGSVAAHSGSSLPAALPLQRALRPFQRYRPRGVITSRTLDESATAEQSVRAGVVLPKFRTSTRREAELQLLMDGSHAMAVWEPMLHQLRDVCERAGVFRRVTVNFLTRGGGARPRIHASWSRAGRPRPAEELFDPTGRRISLLISDCSGPLWQGDALRSLLERWLEHSPVALVQPLPQRLWARTALLVQPGTMRRRPGEYRPLEFESRPPRAAEGAAPPALPVLSPEPAALGTLARLASASRGMALGCAGAWLHGADEGGRAVEPSGEAAGADEVLARFERHASPAARQLAMYLSASALLLPVMLLVQRALIPDSGPAVLGEVLNGGLFQTPEQTGASSSEIWFEFLPGVRELLLQRLTASEAALVLKHCSLYIQRTFGRGARNLPAVVVGYLSGSFREPEGGYGTVPEPFARVSEYVLRRFEPTLAGAEPGGGSGIASLERYDRGGGALDLMEAVELLRAAGPEARLPLARALAAAWRAWRDPDYLDEAERTAQALLDDPSLLREDRIEIAPVLADVLCERARLQAEAGAWHAALADLLRAEEHWRDCLDGPLLPEARTAAAAVGLAEVLRLQVRVEGRLAEVPDGGGADEVRRRVRLLEQAEAKLRHVAGLWQAEEPPGELSLALGRVLLDQVRPGDGATGATGAAAAEHGGTRVLETLFGAVSALRAAVVVLEHTEPPDSAVPREALLDLAEALVRLSHATVADSHAAEEAEEVLTRVAASAAEAGDSATRSRALYRLATLQHDRAARLVEPERLRRAEKALREALSLLPADAPQRPEVLTSLGLLLLEREPATGEPVGVDEAVKVLREAVERSGGQDAELPVRWANLAQALMARFRRHPRLADAFEAEWLLAQADRRCTDVLLSARINHELGAVRGHLARRTENTEHWVGAAHAYARAADAAARAGQTYQAARASYRHGLVLERIAGPEQALAAYRAARELWARAGVEDAPELQDALRRIQELDPRSRPRGTADG
jgi:tetratricopeptide (TPR) repeat protein